MEKKEDYGDQAFWDLQELMTRVEELDEELKEHVDEEGTFPTLKHPLVFQVPYTPMHNAMANQALRNKKVMLEDALKDKNLEKVIWLHERPYRLDALHLAWRECGATSQVLAKMINQVWLDSENIWQNYMRWKELLEISGRNALRGVVDEEDAKTFNELPDRVTVYRGGRVDWEDMMDSMPPFSWTLDIERARWFAHRFEWKPDCYLITAEIDKEDIYFFTDARNEQEVVVDPEGLEVKTIMKLSLPNESPHLYEPLEA